MANSARPDGVTAAGGADRAAGARILVVDDERPIVELIRYNLRREGFDVEVAYDGHEAIERARATSPDLVILDLMLPYVDGLEVCRHLRAQGGRVPILMLTAKDAEHNRVVGLESGADDYVTKPFSPRELVARVRAILRRARDQSRPAETPLVCGSLALNTATHEVRLGDRLIDLTAKEFDLLRLLMSHPNRVFTRDFLLEQIWGYEYFGSTRTVDMHISRLREKIEDDPDSPRFIVTLRGVGYKLKRDAG